MGHTPCATLSPSALAALPGKTYVRLPFFYVRRTQNSRTAPPDERPGAPPPFGGARARHGHPAHLAGSPICRGAAGGEWFLLRCRSAAPHLAGRLREDRGGDEKGDQGEQRVRAHRRLARRSDCAGRKRAARRPWRTAGERVEIQDRQFAGHPGGRGNFALIGMAISSISAPVRTSCGRAISAPTS